jgi:glutamine synthetase
VSFVERHGIGDDARARAAAAVEREIAARDLGVVRLSFADQHGILRGKTVVAAAAAHALANGVSLTTTLLTKDTAHRTAVPVWTAGGGLAMAEMEGAADFVIVPDPTTFRVLPWAPHTGWLLCDAYFPEGRPVPFSTRGLYRGVLERLAAAGYDFVAGLEVEFHLFRLLDPKLEPEHAGQPGTPPAVALLTQGYQYLTELRYDAIDPILEILRRDLQALGLPLRSLEVEYGPSQVELTFQPGSGLEPADLMVLMRSATKQIARRHGYHASFMCRPQLPNVMSSGWHLHQSLRDRKSGANAFVARAPELLSPVARHYLAGLLAHACGATALTTPTINGYKRFRPQSLAPDRVTWGRDNRGAMIRVPCLAGDPATRLENRAGEPAANPYLYMAAQVISGLDGLAAARDPGPSADTPYDAEAPVLPKTLTEALDALAADATLRAGLGDGFVDYYLRIKRAELARFQSEVTDWEQREYFDLF